MCMLHCCLANTRHTCSWYSLKEAMVSCTCCYHEGFCGKMVQSTVSIRLQGTSALPDEQHGANSADPGTTALVLPHPLGNEEAEPASPVLSTEMTLLKTLQMNAQH